HRVVAAPRCCRTALLPHRVVAAPRCCRTALLSHRRKERGVRVWRGPISQRTTACGARNWTEGPGAAYSPWARVGEWVGGVRVPRRPPRRTWGRGKLPRPHADRFPLSVSSTSAAGGSPAVLRRSRAVPGSPR